MNYFRAQNQLLLAAILMVLSASSSTCADGDCERLGKLGTRNVEITSSEVVQTGSFTTPKGKVIGGLPRFCRLAAVLRPSSDSTIRIELWMPETNWNERLEGTGNGGFAGSIAYEALAAGIKRGYSVVNTDMGMAAPPGDDAGIFTGRPERWKDWGYRSTHEMTLQAKRFVTAFYKRPAAHSYFVGCSTGGEQALMEAQRYPDDYDGIVGGAPANNRTGVHVSVLWNFAAIESRTQDRIPVAKLQPLAKAVMAACDGLDGVVDGIVGDPRQCSFDPSTMQCTGDERMDCLTVDQVKTVQRLYAGPVNPRTGQQIYPGLPKGSELGWDRLGPSANGQVPYAPIFYWVFGRNWSWRSFDFDRSFAMVEKKLATDLNATSLNLERFRDRGHKLLVYHGWSDWLVAPGESIKYWNNLEAHSSPSEKLNDYYRLFMAPGMTHCSGSTGPDQFDTLGAMVEWVEKGRAPERIVATQYSGEKASGTRVRTRPLCAHPKVARYQGHGSANDEANFSCVAASR